MSHRTKIEQQEKVEVEIPKKLKDQLEALPDAQSGARGFQWTEELDAILLKYWGVKRQEDIAEIIGVNVGTARRRYRELTDD